MNNTIDLHQYSHIIINTSGGKDSVVAIHETMRQVFLQSYPVAQVHLSHQDLGSAEWKGTYDLVLEQAAHFGISNIHKVKRYDKNGHAESLLEYAERRGAWPSSKQRWCTSDFKRGPGARVVTALTKGQASSKVLYVFGFRAEESPARSKKETLAINKRLTTKKRTVHDWLPVHDWSEKKVWQVIKGHGIPYHRAYDLGMPRLSCVFCIFAPEHALKIAGRNNPELLDEYVAVEKRIGHTFKADLSLADIRDQITESTKKIA